MLSTTISSFIKLASKNSKWYLPRGRIWSSTISILAIWDFFDAYWPILNSSSSPIVTQRALLVRLPFASAVTMNLVERISSTSTPYSTNDPYGPGDRGCSLFSNCAATVFLNAWLKWINQKLPFPPCPSPRSLIQTCPTCSHLFFFCITPHAGLSSNVLKGSILCLRQNRIRRSSHRNSRRMYASYKCPFDSRNHLSGCMEKSSKPARSGKGHWGGHVEGDFERHLRQQPLVP